MALTTGLVALALWGADPVPSRVEPCQEITCEVQVLTIEGLGWRRDAHSMLRPAARQGSATIWTADRGLVARLAAAAATHPTGQATTIKAPRVTTAPGAVATVTSDKTQDYIQHARRVADGPVDHASQVAYVPEVATIREGFTAVFSGRKLDQGVLAQVKFAESHLGSLHTIQLAEVVKTPPTPAPAAPAAGMTTPVAMAVEVVQRLAGPSLGISKSTVQIPEVFLSQVEGEWFVPSDGVLLISMGVNTVADEQGKAVVQERLAVLDFGARAAEADAQACRVDATTAVALENTANLSMPRVPDRSFPEAIDADGKVFDLPPLPEAYAANDLNQISPGSPLATPQTAPIGRPGRSISDPQLARTSFEPIPDSEIQGWTPATLPVPPAGVAAIVEAFLRKGMAAAAPSNAGPDRQEPFPNRVFADIVTELDAAPAAECDAAACHVAGCPFAADGCDEPKSAAKVIAPAQVAIDVRFADKQGVQASSGPLEINAALQNPGKAEVKTIPLGNGVSLRIEAKVVPTAPAADKSAAGTYLEKMSEIDQKLLLLDPATPGKLGQKRLLLDLANPR